MLFAQLEFLNLSGRGHRKFRDEPDPRRHLEPREAVAAPGYQFVARCSAYVAGAYITAQGAQRTRLAASLGALITMVSLDLLLIPWEGAIGAAWAMVAADWVLLSGYLVGSHMTAVTAQHNFAAHGL